MSLPSTTHPSDERLSRRFAFDAILFDVDGTLVDSNAAHADTWAAALRDHGIAVTADEIRPLIGMGADKLLPEVARVEDNSSTGQAMARRKRHRPDHPRPRPATTKWPRSSSAPASRI